MAKARKTRTVYRYAKKKTRRARKFTLPVAMVAGLMPLGGSAVRGFKNEGLTGVGKETTYALTGYHIDSQTFNPSFMWNGTYPLLVGWAVHKIAGVLGVNRALGAARIPFIRI